MDYKFNTLITIISEFIMATKVRNSFKKRNLVLYLNI